MNSLESEKQDLELNSLYDRQPVKLSQCRSYMAKFTKVDVCFFAFLRRRRFYHWL